MELQEKRWEVVGWIDLPLGGDRLLAVVDTAMKRQVPRSAGNLTR
jgi:hypothetical protein